jgi:Salmonella virulence plasmid 65kDa B protein
VGWTEGAFSVSEDGAAQYSLPLWMPKGRGDARPEPALPYNSRSGNGLLGVGWSLQGLSTIAPCDRTFAQDGFRDGVQFDGSDALCLDGNRLLSLTTTPVPEMHYKAERESFLRIIGHGAQLGVPHAAAIRRESVALTFHDQRSGRDARPYGSTPGRLGTRGSEEQRHRARAPGRGQSRDVRGARRPGFRRTPQRAATPSRGRAQARRAAVDRRPERTRAPVRRR